MDACEPSRAGDAPPKIKLRIQRERERCKGESTKIEMEVVQSHLPEAPRGKHASRLGDHLHWHTIAQLIGGDLPKRVQPVFRFFSSPLSLSLSIHSCAVFVLFTHISTPTRPDPARSNEGKRLSPPFDHPRLEGCTNPIHICWEEPPPNAHTCRCTRPLSHSSRQKECHGRAAHHHDHHHHHCE